MGPAVVHVEVLVHVEEEAPGAPVRVGDVGERGRAPAAHQRRGAVEVGPRQQDRLGRGAGVADRRDRLLARGRPEGDVEVVRLVHELEDDLVRRRVLGRQLRPERHELVVGRPPLADDASVPPRKVVDVDHAVCARRQARLDQLIVFSQVRRIQGRAELVVGQELPRDRCIVEIYVLVPEVNVLNSTATAATDGSRDGRGPGLTQAK